MVILIILAFAIIVLFMVPGLIQKKYWPELIAFAILLFLGFSLSLLLVSGVELPFISDTIGRSIRKLLSIK